MTSFRKLLITGVTGLGLMLVFAIDHSPANSDNPFGQPLGGEPIGQTYGNPEEDEGDSQVSKRQDPSESRNADQPRSAENAKEGPDQGQAAAELCKDPRGFAFGEDQEGYERCLQENGSIETTSGEAGRKSDEWLDRSAGQASGQAGSSGSGSSSGSSPGTSAPGSSPGTSDDFGGDFGGEMGGAFPEEDESALGDGTSDEEYGTDFGDSDTGNSGTETGFPPPPGEAGEPGVDPGDITDMDDEDRTFRDDDDDDDDWPDNDRPGEGGWRDDDAWSEGDGWEGEEGDEDIWERRMEP